MININGKAWEDLQLEDVQAFLERTETETYFFDNKEDEVSVDKLAKEVCAFANTFGGYIFLGVSDDNRILGCKKWTEERIHNVLHDDVMPLPIIDIKQFSVGDSYILIVRIEEGEQPPYITNKGMIYERIASGSYPLKDSSRLEALYLKNKENEAKIADKIEHNMPAVDPGNFRNLVGYLDVGASVRTNAELGFTQDFFSADLKRISDILKQKVSSYSISKTGQSYQFVIGSIELSDRSTLLSAGVNNYLELMPDGSFCYRVLLYSDDQSEKTDISGLYSKVSIYKEIYSELIGEDLAAKFVYANKYENLHVYRQFVPYYNAARYKTPNDELFTKYYEQHLTNYGGNRVVTGSRIPRSGYTKIDTQYLQTTGLLPTEPTGPTAPTGLADPGTPAARPVPTKPVIVSGLFNTAFINLGYIDKLETK